MINTQKMVIATAKVRFDQMFASRNVTDANVTEKYPNGAFISIVTPNQEGEQHYFKSDHDNVLNLEFDDADPSVIIKWGEVKIFDKLVDGVKLLDFIKKNENKSFLIHCGSGTGRAGAIAFFIHQLFETDLEKYNKNNPNNVPNAWILKELNYLYTERMMGEDDI